MNPKKHFYKLIILLLTICMLIAGCDSRKEMRERFNEVKFVEITTKDGEIWYLEHHMGNTYNIRRKVDVFGE